MGLLKILNQMLAKKDYSDCADLSNDNHIVLSKNGLFVHPDLSDLVWIGDGKYKNYRSEDMGQIVYPYDGFSVKISAFGSDEPSLLYLNLPIKQPMYQNSVERPPYYPFYRELNPEQRYLYWKFLNDPYNQQNDIGYVFIFYYGLERHLIYGNFDKAFDIILKLRDVYKNKSFQLYSSKALILSAMIHKRPDCAEKFIRSLDKDYEFQIPENLYLLCKFGLNMPITAKDVMYLHKAFGFTNNRYIKNNTGLFLSNLEKNMRELTGGKEILFAEQLFSKTDIQKMKLTEITVFANVSIMDETVEIPDILSFSNFVSSLFLVLSKTHDDTKREVASMRKKQKNGEQDYRKKKICSIECANSTPNEKNLEKTKQKRNTDSQKFNPGALPFDIEKSMSDSANKAQLLKDIDIINVYLEKACALSSIKTKLHISKSDIVFDGTGEDKSYLDVNPYTKTGRLSKYPVTVHYRTKYYSSIDPPKNYFGSIHYLKDGSIGKAELVNWVGKKMYLVKIGIVKNVLVVKSVETIDKSYKRFFIYKIK